MALIDDLKDILDKPERVTAMIRDELKLLQEELRDERRTEIVASAADEFTMESLVADDEVAVTITHDWLCQAHADRRHPRATSRRQRANPAC